jgi:hypothetical protein
MELRALELTVTDEDLTQELAQHLPRDADVKNLRVRVTPEGVRVGGVYPTLMLPVTFETLWTLTVNEGVIEVRLATVQVAGWQTPGPLRGVIWGMVRDALPPQAGVSIGDDAIRVRIDEILASRGIPLQVTLRSVECTDGLLVVRV